MARSIALEICKYEPAYQNETYPLKRPEHCASGNVNHLQRVGSTPCVLTQKSMHHCA